MQGEAFSRGLGGKIRTEKNEEEEDNKHEVRKDPSCSGGGNLKGEKETKLRPELKTNKQPNNNNNNNNNNQPEVRKTPKGDRYICCLG